ncbi:MAG TPA: hypothetical protein VFX49_09245 [Chloroflexota bacterium]|nr:hypothetical protein [Chloroflexota bacterium]
MPHCRGTRRDLLPEALVAIGVAALVAALYLSFAQYGFDVLEEGYFLSNARRVLEGDVPYRDFNTPYTPGIFYLYAWMMERVGANLVALRVVHVAARFVYVLALYAVGRTMSRPFYAVLAPALILSLDTIPGIWSLHPGWLTAPCAIVAVVGVGRSLRSGSVVWLAASGVACGVAFAFKQNLAAYGMMAALWVLVVYERRLRPFPPDREIGAWPARWLARVVRGGVQAAALVLFPLVPIMIALPNMSPLVAGSFIAPLVALSLVGLASIARGSGRTRVTYGRELAFYARPAVVLGAFGAVTASWFVPFYRALGERTDLLGPIVGRIEQTGYFLGMLPPGPDHARALGVTLLPAVLLPAVAVARLWSRTGVALALLTGAVVVVATAVASWGQRDPWNAVDWLVDLRGLAQRAGSVEGEGAYSTGELVLYLPLLAFWVGLAVMLARPRASRQNLALVWALAAGAALLFNQYPRMDSIHLLWSGGVLFAVGAAAMERWEGLAQRAAPALRRSGGTLALRAALLTLPVTAALPTLFARVEYGGQFFRPAARPEELTRREGPYGLLRLDVANDESHLWLPGKEALDYQEIAQMIGLRTAPGEPIFAYPAIPGFYYLTGRHNPTKFNHLFPGIASEAEQAEMVRQLERVNYVIWDDAGAHFWVWPGVNAPLTEYIRTTYRIERFVGQYAILSRQAVIDWGEVLYYPLPGTDGP